MKRVLCVMLTAVLVLALCVTACAEAYTHPEAGFQLTIPEGWLAVDSTNVVELINSSRVSAGMADVMVAIRGILDSTYSVFMFQADAPPFVNVAVEYKGDFDWEITLEDLLVTAQAYETYYLEDPEQFPGYTVVTPAGAEQVEGWYPMGYLGGVYEVSDYRIALMQVFVAAGTQFYEFTLTAEEDKAAEVNKTFGDLVGSFVAPGSAPEVGGAQADADVLKRGTELMEAQDFGGALAHFDAAIAERGDVAEYHAQRGAALLWLEQYQEMADSYSAAILLDADYWEYYNERGVAYFYMGKWDEALADFQKAVDLDDPGEDAYINLAYLQRELGDAEESVVTCALGLTDYPESDDLWGILGDAQFDLGHYAEALTAYDTLLATGDYAAEDITNYAAAQELAGKPPALLTYSLDDESIPSVDSVVGFREIPNTESGFSKGSPFVKVHYRSASVLADLQAYVTALIDDGWAATQLQGDASGGMILLATKSAQDGKLLMVTAEYTDDAYSVLMQRADGTLRRYTDGDGNKLGEILHADARAATAAQPDDIIGVWYLNSVEMMGMSMHPSELDLEMSMEFFADNTASLYSSTYRDTKGSWAIQDGRIIVSPENGTDVVFTLMDGNLCDDQIGMVFGKEKEEVGSN